MFESDNPTTTVIESLWNHGVVINVLACGYSIRSIALTQITNIPHFEVYRHTQDGKVLNDNLGNFPKCSNRDNLVEPSSY